MELKLMKDKGKQGKNFKRGVRKTQRESGEQFKAN